MSAAREDVPHEATDSVDPGEQSLDSMNEKSMARHLWWRVGYFLIGIHVLAAIFIWAASHAPR